MNAAQAPATRAWSLAYLTANSLDAVQAVQLAGELGYSDIGLRLQPNAAGAPFQALLGRPELMRATRAALKDCGVKVFDIEIIRIGENFSVTAQLPLMEAAAELGARAILVAGDDPDHPRLALSYAALCDAMRPFGLSADLEFMPWTAVADARSALAIVQAAGEPANAGILVDAIHFARSNTTLDDIKALPRQLLHYAQICDAPARPSHGGVFSTEEMIHAARVERLLPGEGDIPLAALFAALPAGLPVSIEIPNEPRIARLGQKQWAQLALQHSRATLSG